MRRFFSSFLIKFFLVFFLPLTVFAQEDPLPSWKEGLTKSQIIEFVTLTTNRASLRFVPEEERVAVFDLDGTLWCEKPKYVQSEFIEQNLLQLAHAMRVDDYNSMVREFLQKTRHPRFHQFYTDLFYQPMKELLALLLKEKFKLYICSGSDTDFMRVFLEEELGVLKENIIGTTVHLLYSKDDDEVTLRRSIVPVLPFNDQSGKVINIQRYIGRKPILACGNSNGDLDMLLYTDQPSLTGSLILLVQHDDSEREYSYTSNAERVQKMAQERGWATISIRHDFKKVFVK